MIIINQDFDSYETKMSSGYMSKPVGVNVVFLSIVYRKHESNVARYKAWIRKCFAIKDLEDTYYILGIRIYHK